ncbi:GNAT domain-containing protein [Daldinia sp. FL1419]|nr:GNAT domain-containing protein [Daldinia sp. FL1419]
MARYEVETTLPFLEVQKWAKPTITERLILRPLCFKDLEGFHALFNEPEAMALAYVGGKKAQPDMIHNAELMIQLMRPWGGNTVLDFAVLLQTSDGEEGDFIGMASITVRKNWPDLGYMLRKQYWGHGYATEAVNALLEFWWNLPRSRTTIHVTRDSLGRNEINALTIGNEKLLVERIMALAESRNKASQRVLKKAGFQQIGFRDDNILFRKIFPIAETSPEHYRDLYWGPK